MNNRRYLIPLLSSILSIASISTVQAASITEKDVNSLIETYINDHPEIIYKSLIKYQQVQTDQKKKDIHQAVSDNYDEIFNSKTDPVLGNSNADVSVVVFLDYACGHCRRMHSVIDKELASDKNIKVVIKELPVLGAGSLSAAKAAIAAPDNASFIKLHDKLLAMSPPYDEAKILQAANSANINTKRLKKAMNSSWVEDRLKANFKLANALKIEGTPAIVISSKKNPSSFLFFPGALSSHDFSRVINSFLKASN